MSIQEDIWNGVDIKVRKLVRDLLEPSLIKFSEVESNQNKITRILNENRDRISQVQNKVDILGPKIPNIDPIHRKLNEFSIRVNSLDNDLLQQIDSIRNYNEKLSSKVSDIGTKFQSISKQNDLFSQTLAENSKTCSNLRIFIEKKVTEFQNQLKDPFNTQAETNILFLSQIRELEIKAESLIKDLDSVGFLARKNEHDLKNGLDSIEKKVSSLIKPLSFYENEITGIRNLVLFNESKFRNEMKEEVERLKNEFKLQIKESFELFGKNQQSNLTEVLNFVLKEPKYQRKLNQLKKMNTMRVENKRPVEMRRFTESSIWMQKERIAAESELIGEEMKAQEEELKFSEKKGIEGEGESRQENGNNKEMGSFNAADFFNERKSEHDRNGPDDWKDWPGNRKISDSELAIDVVSSSNEENSLSTNETQKTGDAKQKFVFSRADSKNIDSDLESISEECSEGRLIEDNMFIKQIKSDLSALIQKHESLSTELKSFSSKSSIKINSLRFCIILLKHQQQKALDQFKESFDSSLKSWTKDFFSSNLSQFTHKIQQDIGQIIVDSKRIIEQNQVLELSVNNVTSEFGGYLKGKKRDLNDTKLEISRIYKKFETFAKKQVIHSAIIEKLQNLVGDNTGKGEIEKEPKVAKGFIEKLPSLQGKVNQTPKSIVFVLDKKESFGQDLDFSEVNSPDFKSLESFSRSHTPELPIINRMR